MAENNVGLKETQQITSANASQTYSSETTANKPEVYVPVYDNNHFDIKQTKEKKEKNCFWLFSTSTKGMDALQKTAYISFNAMLVLLATLALGFSSLLLAYGSVASDAAVAAQPRTFFAFVWDNLPWVLVFTFGLACVITGRVLSQKAVTVTGVAVMVVMALIIGCDFCHFITENGIPNVIFLTYIRNPYVLALNLIPPILLFGLFYVIVGRAWLAYILDGALVLGFSIANYFLLMFRNDPLMFIDVLNFREALEISKEGYDYKLTPQIVLAVAAFLFFLLVLIFFHRHKLNISSRVYVLALSLAFIFPMKDVYFDPQIYNVETYNMNPEHMNIWSPTNQYLSRGFIYPFIYSFQSAFEMPPEGYNEDEAKAILESYERGTIPDDKKVHVVGVMLEAYCDLESTLGVTGINPEAYEHYRKLRDENYSGKLITNIFAGGTIDTERGFMSGFTGLVNCRKNTNSYVHFFAENGYKTMGSHPSQDWFYNRRNVNEYLGFSDYRFKENYFGPKYEEKYGDYGLRTDALVFNDFFDQYKDVADNTETPYFGFNVTYQGHGPYNVDIRERGTDVNPLYENPAISAQSNNILNNYLASLKDTGIHLNAFVEKIMAESEPTIVVIFGDHKPWLGDSNSVYTELGVSFDFSTPEGFMNYYSTEYIFIANDAAKEMLGNDFKGQGPVTSPCFLMNVLFDEMGITGTEYMQYTNDVRKNFIAVNEVGIIDAEGNYYPHSALPEELRVKHKEYNRVTFYEKTNFRK